MHNNNNKGQALVELAGSLSLLLILIFGMISVGCYIYDKCVFNQAINKALDRAIAVSVSGKLSGQDQKDIKQLAVNYASGSVFTSQPVSELTISPINKSTKQLEISLVSDYNCNIPFFTQIFGSKPQVSEKSLYEYKTK